MISGLSTTQSGNNTILRRFTSFILDTVFPPYCLYCEKEGSWACTPCRTHFVRADTKYCPLCGSESGNGYVCDLCHTTSSIRQIVSVVRFGQKGVQNIVHALKYENIRGVAPWMGRCMAAVWDLRGSERPECIIPIPLHASRLYEREYNQAALLGKIIQEILEIPMQEQLLIRNRKTTSQTKLSSEERKENVKECFVVRNDCVLPKSVLLIDDVCTTGATVCEAARILKSHGVESVCALVFAHG